MKKGFTLIELLVVVLIIGILSAVALPQYTKAVKKSRVANMQPTLKALLQAGQVYRLANGDVLVDIDDLDIEIPSTSFDLKEDGVCQYGVTRGFSTPQKLAAVCQTSGYKLIFGIADNGLLFCGGYDAPTICKEYGFPKPSTE